MDLFKTVSDYIDDNYIIKRAYSIKTISTLNNFYVVEVIYSFDKRTGTYNIHKGDLLDYIVDNFNKDIKCNHICKRCFLDFNDNASFYYNHGAFYMLNSDTNVYDEDGKIVQVLQIASVKDSKDYELVRMLVYSINNLLQKKVNNKILEPAEVSYLRISFNYIEDICKLDLKLINYK